LSPVHWIWVYIIIVLLPKILFGGNVGYSAPPPGSSVDRAIRSTGRQPGVRLRSGFESSCLLPPGREASLRHGVDFCGGIGTGVPVRRQVSVLPRFRRHHQPWRYRRRRFPDSTCPVAAPGGGAVCRPNGRSLFCGPLAPKAWSAFLSPLRITNLARVWVGPSMLLRSALETAAK
jgi:hypothetical protein